MATNNNKPRSTQTQSRVELDSPTVSAFRNTIAEVQQGWSVIGWVIKNLLSRERLHVLYEAQRIVLRKARKAVDPGSICSR
jgi:hypothetical protein